MKSTKIMASTKNPNKIFDKIIASDFTRRELKVLLLIIKGSYGLGSLSANLSKKDFFKAGILPYHVEDVVKGLVLRCVVNWNSERGIFWINSNLKEWIDKKRKVSSFKE